MTRLALGAKCGSADSSACNNEVTAAAPSPMNCLRLCMLLLGDRFVEVENQTADRCPRRQLGRGDRLVRLGIALPDELGRSLMIRFISRSVEIEGARQTALLGRRR